MVTSTFNPNDLQGNILRGYRFKRVRHLILEVANACGGAEFSRKVRGGRQHRRSSDHEGGEVGPRLEANPVLQHRCDL